MGRNLDDIIKGLPADRQAKIATLSHQKFEEMLAHASTLTDFRKAVGMTQAEVAKKLGIKQNAVSQLEKRSDTYVSTLRRFLKSLGMKLELSVVSKNGARIDLPNFLPWHQASSVANDSDAFAVVANGRAKNAAATRAPVRKIAEKAVRVPKVVEKTTAAKRAVSAS